MKDWHSLSRFKKRLHGFACYTVSAFVALFISPEIADMAMYDTLKEQFDAKKNNSCITANTREQSSSNR